MRCLLMGLLTLAAIGIFICASECHGAGGMVAKYPIAYINQCVPHKLAMEAWAEALDKAERPVDYRRLVQPVCDPCSCPTNGMAACYEYMAKEERIKANKRKYMNELLDQARMYGVCGKGD